MSIKSTNKPNKPNKIYKISHPYHIVNFSPWPFLVSMSLLLFIISLLLSFHLKIKAFYLFINAVILLLISIFSWLFEVNNESTYRGDHTDKVKSLLLYGFILFVISESSLFIGLFISEFYFALSPSAELGSNWPPEGINVLNPQSTPLFNTAVLFTSGYSITLAQNYFYLSLLDTSYIFLLITILLGSLFSYLQYMEYFLSSFTISDSVYGSTFYMLTGFHGAHVIIGTILLLISFYRLSSHLSTFLQPIFLFMSALYWHFVDYVWLFLFVVIYCWLI